MRCHYADLLLRGPFCAQKRIQRCVECEYTEFMLTNYFGNTPLVHWRLLVVLLRMLYRIENIEEINPAGLLFVLTVQLLKYLSTTPGFMNGSATVCGSSFILAFFEQNANAVSLDMCNLYVTCPIKAPV